jgi:hypothetical protein
MKNFPLGSLLFILIVFSTAVSARPKPVAVIELLPHPGGTHMMTVRATVNGHPGLFMFDTGGGISYIDPAFAKKIGCEPWGQLSGFVLTGQRLDMPRCESVKFSVGRYDHSASTIGVYDIGQFMPKDAPHVDGSIGLDLFAGSTVTLSLAKRTLTVESGDSLRSRTKSGREIEIRLVRELEGLALAVVAAVQTPKGKAWMELDSGNGGANVVGKHLARIFSLEPEKKEPQAGRFALSDGLNVDGPFRVNPTLIMDGNIGTRFLIDWDLTLDLSKGRGWLSAASGK